MVRPARSRRSTSKATFRPSSRVYWNRLRRRSASMGTGPDRSVSAGAAAFGLTARTPQIKIDVQSGGGAAPLPTPLASYAFNGVGSSITDDSGNGHDFTAANGVELTGSGHTSGGLTNSTAGTGSLITSMFGQTTDRTFMCWGKDLPNVFEWPWIWNVSSIDSGAWGLLILGTDVCVQARNASGFVRAGTTRPTDGLWHHFAFSYNEAAGELKFYLDGALVDTQSLTGPLRTDADQMKIMPNMSGLTLDDVRIFDSTLDIDTIADFMATPVGEETTPESPHLAPLGIAGQNATVAIKVNPGVASIDWPARNAIPVQNIACAWFEATVTVDQHFCTIDPDAYETTIVMDAHEGVVGAEEHYGDVVICGRP